MTIGDVCGLYRLGGGLYPLYNGHFASRPCICRMPSPSLLIFFSSNAALLGAGRGMAFGHINEITQRRAGLVLRWVTDSVLVFNQAVRPTQPRHPSVGNEY